MSGKLLKRPSSAKRHIKYETFSQFVSASRLRRVQDLLDDGAGDSSKRTSGIDAILCVSGIDSRYNDGSYELINYLLFGFFDVRKAELEKSGFADEVIDDLMILICKTRVDVYCNPVNWHYFLPYTSHWTNVTLHCLQEEEYDLDTDEEAETAEEFKVQSLIAMTSGCHHIGIPYYGMQSDSERTFNKMLLEKWPIIQAFALDDFGGGGFFTMKFEVSDISESIHELHSYQDPVTIEILTTVKLPMLERQWRNMCDSVNMEIANHAGVITQECIAEPLRSFYQHGRVGNHRLESGKCKMPYVLFGRNSSRATIEAVELGDTPPPGTIKLGENDSVRHMVCHVMSPRSPITCTRTYFVSHLFTADSEVEENKQPRNEVEENKQPLNVGDASTNKPTELRYLVTLYNGMVEAVMAAIQLYSRTASFAQARLTVQEVLNDRCSPVLNSGLASYLSDRSKVKFSIESVQKYGSMKEVVDGQRTAMVKVATLSMYDVPASQPNSPSPGSLIFAECFLDSAIAVTGTVQTSVDHDILYLTSHIPRHILWGVGENTREQLREVRSHLESSTPGKMGAKLMTGDKVELTAGTYISLPAESVNLYVFENGITVVNEHYGAFTLQAADCTGIKLFDGDSMTTAVLLMVTYHARAADKLPPHLVTPNNTLYLVFAPHSKAHMHLYGEVLTRWKEGSEMPAVNRIESEELPDELDRLHSYLQQVRSDTGRAVSASPSQVSMKDAARNLPQLTPYLNHLSVSTTVAVPVSRSDLPHLLQKEPEFSVSSDNEQVVVTVLTGVPGSEKQSLCKTLSLLGKDYIRWVVVRQMEECLLDAGQIHKMLTAAVTSHLQQDKNRKQTRVLLVAPGFMNTPDVVGAVLRHPDAKIRNMLKIGAVTACIDPLNTFMQHRMVLPMLLNQCAQGWVNNIVFTSQTKAPSKLLDTIQSVIRSVNSDVALLLAESGEVKRSTDLDQILSDSAFEQPAMIRARLLLYPAWKLQIKSAPLKSPLSMNDILLRFSKPLEKTKLLQRMKGLFTSLKTFPFEGNIYHTYGLVCFSDSQSTVDIQYTTLSQSLVLRTLGSHTQPVIRGQHQYYMVFTGCALKEAELKDWLRTCARQKPEKKSHVTRKDLSRADIAKIHKDRHLEPLPSGWFYNGTQFVSMAGEKSNHHPSMEEFITTYLKTKNEEIDKYNAAIDKEKWPDLFA